MKTDDLDGDEATTTAEEGRIDETRPASHSAAQAITYGAPRARSRWRLPVSRTFCPR